MKRSSCAILILVALLLALPTSTAGGGGIATASQEDPSRRVVSLEGESPPRVTAPRSAEISIATIVTTLRWGSFLGGSNGDGIRDIVVDDAGSIYVCGESDGGFRPGAFDGVAGFDQVVGGGLSDAFAAKFTPDGSNLVWFNYYGSTGEEKAISIALNSSGCAFIAGWTDGVGFSPKYGSFGAVQSAFVFVVSADGTWMDWDRGLSGNGQDRGHAVGVDADNYVYIAGSTGSSDFPTLNSFDSIYGGGGDGFLTKIAPNGTVLNYSTYLGGSDWEYITDLVVGSLNTTYVCGQTDSGDFPTTAGAHNRTYGGNRDGFMTRFVYNFALPHPLAINSTFFGGYQQDVLNGIDYKDGGVYVAGFTKSNDFPATPGAWNTTFGDDECSTAVVAKFNWSCGLNWSTFFGGRAYDTAQAIAVSRLNESWVYVAGDTGNTISTGDYGFPTTPGAFSTVGDYQVPFLSVFSENGSDLKYSTVIGTSSENDVAYGVAPFNRSCFVAGVTISDTGNDAGFPSTAGSYQPDNDDDEEGWVCFVPIDEVPPSFGSPIAPSSIELGADFTTIINISEDLLADTGVVATELVLDGTHYPMQGSPGGPNEYNWTVTDVNEPSRSLAYSFGATDWIGLSGSSPSYSVRVGDVPNIETIERRSEIEVDNIFWVHCFVSDDRTGDSGVSHVNLTFGDDIYSMVEDTANPGNWSWFRLLTETGSFSWYITAYDNRNNHNSTTAYRITVTEAEEAGTKTVEVPYWWPAGGESWVYGRYHIFFTATAATTIFLGLTAGKIRSWSEKRRRIVGIKRRSGL